MVSRVVHGCAAELWRPVALHAGQGHIIPHAGAYIPYQAERIATAGRQGLSGGPERMAQLKRLSFDTAMSGETAYVC